MYIDHIILYGAVFISTYVQVFFLLTFIEKRKELKKEEIKAGGKNMLSDYPEMTFLVPCWNESKTVIGTIKSIRALEYPQSAIKIIAINDGSTDDTFEVLNKYKEELNISVFTKKNGGKHSALNLALENVDTYFFASIDADTTLDKYALAYAFAQFEKDPDLSAVGGSVLIRNPRTIAERAQSIEYAMFSFTKKMLGLLGGVLVVPGAFSLFKTNDVRKIGAYRLGSGLEDLELTYRLQTNGYKVNHSHQALAFTGGPKSIKTLFKQRLRWGFGFINTTYEYRKAVLNSKFGNFGFFTLPMSILSYLVISCVFFISWYNMFSFLIDKITIVRLIGFSHPVVSFNLFFVSTQALVFLGLMLMIFFFTFITLGHKISRIPKINLGNTAIFFLVYSFLVPFWVLKSIQNSLISARPSWR